MRDCEADAFAGAWQLAGGEADKNQRGVEVAHRARDRIGQRGIARGHVVQRAVWLHVTQACAGRAHEARQCADLVQGQGVSFAGIDAHLAAAEAHQIRQRHMRADRHPGARGEADCAPHRVRIAGMETAGDVRGAHIRENFGVLAHRPRAERFAHIAIEVDGRGFPLRYAKRTLR